MPPRSHASEKKRADERRSVEDIARAIGRMIRRRELLAGEPLRERQLAIMFGVSRGPVREALRMLAARGLLTIEPNRGARVVRLSDTEARDILEIGGALLRHAVEMAAERASSEDGKALIRCADAIGEAGRSGVAPGAFTRLETEFLNHVLKIVSNARLSGLINDYVYEGPGGTYAPLGVATPARQRSAARAWKKVADAIAANQPDVAGKAFGINYRQGVDCAMALMDITGLATSD